MALEPYGHNRILVQLAKCGKYQTRATNLVNLNKTAVRLVRTRLPGTSFYFHHTILGV